MLDTMINAKRLLILSILMVLVGLLQPLAISLMGFRIPYLFTTIELLALPFLMLATFLYKRLFTQVPGIDLYRFKVYLLINAILLLAIYGLIKGNLIQLVIFDVWTYLYIACFLFLGRNDQVWIDLEKPLIVLFWVIFIFTLFGLFRARPTVTTEEVTFGEMVGERIFVQSVGYPTSKLLDFWPLVFMLGYFRPRFDKWKFLGITTIFAFLFLQLLFYKRAPLVRALVYAVTVMLFILVFGKKSKVLTNSLMFTLMIILCIVTLLSINYELLINRFIDIGTFSEIDRVQEALAMLSDMNQFEFLVGKGMGGYFKPPEGWPTGVEINSEGGLVRTDLHIGILQPLLKGGLFFCLIYYSFFIPMFLRKSPEWYTNRFNIAAMNILPVYTLFLLIEGPPTYVAVPNAMLIGMVCARLGSLSSRRVRIRRI